MARAKCTTCNTPIELSPNEPMIKCPNCGKTYKNPIYKKPEVPVAEVNETPAVTNEMQQETVQTVMPAQPQMQSMPTAMANLLQNSQEVANRSNQDDTAEKCVTHTNLNAVYECDKCGAPICEICYENFDMTDDEDDETYHFCANCYKEFVVAEREEANDLKKMVRKEFIGIFIGMFIGLILAIAFITDNIKSGGSTFLVIASIYAMFLGGSFITIAKKIKNMYNEERTDDTSTNILMVVMYVIIGIMISPFVTIARIILRIIDYKKLNAIIARNVEFVNTLDNAIQESVTQALNMVVNMEDALESGSVEVNVDFNLGDGVAIGENGEILRAIRTR